MQKKRRVTEVLEYLFLALNFLGHFFTLLFLLDVRSAVRGAKYESVLFLVRAKVELRFAVDILFGVGILQKHYPKFYISCGEIPFLSGKPRF